MATVFVPAPLRRLTGGQGKVTVAASTVNDLLTELEASFPGVKERLLDDNGEIKRFINVFVDGDEIRGLSGGDTAIKENSEVSIIPAMAGGNG